MCPSHCTTEFLKYFSQKIVIKHFCGCEITNISVAEFLCQDNDKYHPELIASISYEIASFFRVEYCLKTFYTLVAPFTKNDSQRSYRLLATLAGYMVVSLTLITTARRSPLERFGLNVSC